MSLHKLKIADLKLILAEMGLSRQGKTKKADLIALIENGLKATKRKSRRSTVSKKRKSSRRSRSKMKGGDGDNAIVDEHVRRDLILFKLDGGQFHLYELDDEGWDKPWKNKELEKETKIAVRKAGFSWPGADKYDLQSLRGNDKDLIENDVEIDSDDD